MVQVEPIRKLQTIKKIRSVLAKQSKRNELLFIIGINVGLRVSDLLQLKVFDVLNRANIVITEKKTKKVKKFYVNETVNQLVEAFVKSENITDAEAYLFESRKGGPISRIQAYRILNSAFEEVGLVSRNCNGILTEGQMGTHTMRKTFGYHAYKNGVSIELLMDIMNHSSVTQTLKYIGITEQKKKEVYLNLNLG